MQVTETNAEGLKREYKITVEADVIDSKLDEKLQQLAGRIRLPGFRPGKVPVGHLRKLHGDALMGEVLEETVNATTREALEKNELRPAMRPNIEITSFERGSALEYQLSVEVLPEIIPGDLGKVKLERQTAPVGDADIEEALQRIAEGQKAYKTAAKTYKAKKDDSVVIDFLGKRDGEPFEGGTAEDYELVLGSNSLIPGFEDQLIGAKTNEKRDVNVTFPDDYGSEELAGKDAVFEVTVKEVKKPIAVPIDDELAQKVGLESLEQLRERLKEQVAADFNRVSRMKLKRSMLDQLADMHDFPVPEGMVDMEFNQIWQDFETSLKQEGKTLETADKPEDELRTEYREIAVRRVRLGLLLSNIGDSNEITVNAEELNRAIMMEAQRFPGQERQVFEFYQKNPDAMQQVRAPIFEEKVIDFILEKAEVTEKEVDRETLLSDPEEDAAADSK
ncbi:trigger factor [Emcibacter sp. SYSU 3D8]|uniref:trigger factor n=1 Tax=Emcibacter sp. SYSU 3D8 TaxID=3133969 RepID=UPI0031FEED70